MFPINKNQSSGCCSKPSNQPAAQVNRSSVDTNSVSFVKFTRVFSVTDPANKLKKVVKTNPTRLNSAFIVGYFPRKKLAGAQNYLLLSNGKEIDVKESTKEIENKLRKAGATIIV